MEDGDVRDELPEDLDRGFVGAYIFPDNRRRRTTGALYLVVGALVLVMSSAYAPDAVLANAGLTIGAVGLVLFGLYSVLAGRKFGLNENEALVAASKELGFAVGHASAQLGWRGFLSRPTWRILAYSAEDPPISRSLVLIDAIDGTTIDAYIEDNPEDWISTSNELDGLESEAGLPESEDV